jgi:hypothetical protein
MDLPDGDRSPPAAALRVRDLGDGRTRLILRFGYSSPGPLGFLADVMTYGRVRDVLRGLIGAIKAEAERPPRKRATRAKAR